MEIQTFALETSPASPTTDAVRAHTASEVNERIDRDTIRRIWHYATQAHQTITERIERLDREWDIEKAAEASTASASLFGLLMGASRSRKWLLLPAASLGCLLQHSLAGWSPPFQLFRYLGIRTRQEIDAEKYALKLLRGDFDSIKSVCEQTHLAIEAVKVATDSS